MLNWFLMEMRSSDADTFALKLVWHLLCGTERNIIVDVASSLIKSGVLIQLQWRAAKWDAIIGLRKRYVNIEDVHQKESWWQIKIEEHQNSSRK